jgi:hypothetical protein
MLGTLLFVVLVVAGGFALWMLFRGWQSHSDLLLAFLASAVFGGVRGLLEGNGSEAAGDAVTLGLTFVSILRAIGPRSISGDGDSPFGGSGERGQEVLYRLRHIVGWAVVVVGGVASILWVTDRLSLAARVAASGVLVLLFVIDLLFLRFLERAPNS